MIIGIGIDLVNIERFLPRQEAIAKKILTENEYTIYETLQGQRQLEFLAGHFAAKEALVKAMPKETLLSDFEIFYKNNKPCVNISNYNSHLSISHDGLFATAIAILESRD